MGTAIMVVMEHERNAQGAHKVMLAFFAVFITAVIVLLCVFIIRRMDEVSKVCEEEYAEGVEVKDFCKKAY